MFNILREMKIKSTCCFLFIHFRMAKIKDVSDIYAGLDVDVKSEDHSSIAGRRDS